MGCEKRRQGLQYSNREEKGSAWPTATTERICRRNEAQKAKYESSSFNSTLADEIYAHNQILHVLLTENLDYQNFCI